MKMTMGLKKGDIMMDAMQDFWGQSKKLESPQEVNVIGMSQDAPNPQEAYDDYEAEGKSIKERVEEGIDETKDLKPNTRVADKYSKTTKSNPFDLGGLDEMNQRQLARERGSGLGLGLGFGEPQEKLSYEDKTNRIIVAEKIKAIKADTALSALERKLALQQARINMNASAQQARSMAEARAQINRSFKEDTTRSRYQTGLPVYESPLDVIAGGKVREMELNKVTGKMEPTGKIVRYGGLFGAVQEGYSGYKKAAPVIARGAGKLATATVGFGKAAVEGGKKASVFIDKRNEEFAEDAKGVFRTAKTGASKVFDAAKLKVDSYYDNHDIDKTVNDFNSGFLGNQPKKMPRNVFLDDILSRKEQEKAWVPKQKSRSSNLNTRSYEGRNLNPDIVDMDLLNPGRQIYEPKPFKSQQEIKKGFGAGIMNEVIAGTKNDLPPFVKTPIPSDIEYKGRLKFSSGYNEGMINTTMAELNKESNKNPFVGGSPIGKSINKGKLVSEKGYDEGMINNIMAGINKDKSPNPMANITNVDRFNPDLI